MGVVMVEFKFPKHPKKKVVVEFVSKEKKER